MDSNIMKNYLKRVIDKNYSLIIYRQGLRLLFARDADS
jgi:hypothetical protein